MVISCRLVFHKRCILNLFGGWPAARRRDGDCSAGDNFTWCCDGKLGLFLHLEHDQNVSRKMELCLWIEYGRGRVGIFSPSTGETRNSGRKVEACVSQAHTHPSPSTSTPTTPSIHTHPTTSQTLSQGDCLPALSSVAMPSWALM